jgi:hypothetical protein
MTLTSLSPAIQNWNTTPVTDHDPALDHAEQR